MISRLYSGRKAIVGTTKRSIAAIPSAWLRRNVFHPCEGGPLLRTIYLATLVWPISMPSLSNSPWIRGAPHNGLAMLISRISRRISNDTVVSTATASRFPAPIQPKTGAVPADHSIGSDDCKCIIHLGKQPADTSQYQPVNRRKSKSLGIGTLPPSPIGAPSTARVCPIGPTAIVLETTTIPISESVPCQAVAARAPDKRPAE